MKKTLLILFISLTTMLQAQVVTTKVVRVPNSSTVFGSGIPAYVLIIDASTYGVWESIQGLSPDLSINTCDSTQIINLSVSDTAFATKIALRDTAISLRLTIAEKLNISDSASMLSYYLRKGDTTLMLLPYHGKLNISDTAAMLAYYKNELVGIMHFSDTSLMLAPYLKIADTSSMLSSYASKTLVSTKLNISDTASMLVPYAKNSLVDTKLNISDTTGMLSWYKTSINTNTSNIGVNASNINTNSDSLSAQRIDINTVFDWGDWNAGNLSTGYIPYKSGTSLVDSPIYTDGNGTTSLGAKLEIETTSVDSVQEGLRITNPNAGISAGSKITFYQGANDNIRSVIESVWNPTVLKQDLVFYTGTSGSPEKVMRLSDGKVAIGVYAAFPSASLSYGQFQLNQSIDSISNSLTINSTLGQALRLWVDGDGIRRISGGVADNALIALNGGGTGSVLINTLTDNGTAKLQVNGNGYFSGTLTASNLSGTNTGDQDISGIATNTLNISINKDSLTVHRTDINANTNTNTIQGDTLVAHNTRILANKSSINTNISNISTNATNISTNTGNITTNTSNITTNTNTNTIQGDTLTAHNTRILANKSAIATKQDTITTGDTTQYFRGDLSLAVFPTALSYFTNDLGNYGGFLTSETDPVWVSDSATYAAKSWVTAKNYLTSYTETDPTIYAWAKASTKPGYTTDEVTEGTTNLYYTDARVAANSAVTANTAKNSFPGFSTLSNDYGFTDNSTNWNNAYDSIPYLRADINVNTAKVGITTTQASDITTNNAKVTESTTVSTPLVLTGTDVSIPAASGTVNGYLSSADWTTFNGKLSSFTETDPVYTASEASNITATDITNLGNLSGVNTGDQDLSGYYLASNPNGYISSYTETDPIFVASPAYSITATDITNLSNLSGTNTGDQDLSGLEAALGDPSTDGYVLSSTAAGVRSWVVNGSGGQPQLDGTGFVKASGTVISYDTNSYLPLTGGTMTGTIYSTSIIPITTDNYTLGTSTNEFSFIYSQNATISNGLGVDGYIHNYGYEQIDGTLNVGDALTVTGNILPTTSNTTYLGTSTDYFGETNTYNFNVYGSEWITGNSIVTGTVTAADFILSSDSTLKKDIEPIKPDVLNIPLIQFKFKADTTNREHYGIIAQNLLKVAPQMVYKGKDGKLRVAYIDFLVARSNSLEKKVDRLQAQLDNQGKLIKDLEIRMKKFEDEK